MTHLKFESKKSHKKYQNVRLQYENDEKGMKPLIAIVSCTRSL